MNKSFGKRFISMLVAICMILTAFPLSVLAVGGEDPEETGITVGRVLAATYDELSEAEKALLRSGLLAGDTLYQYVEPTDGSGLISVDTENKTVTAGNYTDDHGNVWVPVEAYIVAKDREDEPIEPNGEDTYEYDGNNFSVKVLYQLYIDVATDAQAEMLSIARKLKSNVDLVDTLVAAQEALSVLEDPMIRPELVALAKNGYSLMGNPVVLESKEHILALDEQMTANGGKLYMSDMLAAYSAGKTEYLLSDTGLAMKEELAEVTARIKAIYTNLSAIYGVMSGLINLGYVSQAEYALVGSVVNKLGVWSNKDDTGAADKALDAEWAAAGKAAELLKAGIAHEEYHTLDTLVEALDVNAITGDSAEITQTHLPAVSATVQYNMNMYDVTVKVQLQVVENAIGSQDFVDYDEKSTTLTLVDGATAQDVLDALAETGLENAALADWAGVYVAGKFDRAETTLPAELHADTEYVITYTPAGQTVTYVYGSEVQVPYGYQLLLEKHGEDNKVYDYYVDGAYYEEGSVVQVLDDMTIDRAEGKPYSAKKLYTVVGSNFGTSYEQAILQSGAVLGNQVINVRYPDTTGEDSTLVRLVEGVLTAEPYSSSYENLQWIPYFYTVDGERFDFVGNSAVIDKPDYDEVLVYYVLTLTTFGRDTAQSVLDLVETLVGEAKSQKSVLDSLSSPAILENIDMLGGSMLTIYKSLIESTVLHSDDAKNAALKACFTAALDGIGANCLTGVNTGSPKLKDHITGYNNNGLNYYYGNGSAFINEIDLLSGYLNMMLAEDATLTAAEKVEALAALIRTAPSNIIKPEDVDNYVSKLTDLQAEMDTIRASLKEPNAAIDISDSNKLSTLVNALEDAIGVAGAVGSTATGSPYLLTDAPFVLPGSGKVVIRVFVKFEDNDPLTAQVTVKKDEAVQAAAIENLKSQVAAILETLGISDPKYYGCEEYANGAALDALVGEVFSQSQSYTFEWVEKELTYCEKVGHHTYGPWQVITKPTCTEPGEQKRVCIYECVDGIEIEAIDPLGHDMTFVQAVEADCENTGIKAHYKCEECGKLYWDADGNEAATLVDVTIPEKGHDWNADYSKDNEKHWIECKRDNCDAVKEQGDHQFDDDNCMADATCIICGFFRPAGTGHNWQWVYDDQNPSQHKRECACGAHEEAPHNAAIVAGESYGATCTEPGLKVTICDVCNDPRTRVEEPIPATDHKWPDAWVFVDSDLEYHYKECLNGCSETLKEAHDWKVVSSTDEGLVTYGCDICGGTKTVVEGVTDRLEAGQTVIAAITPDKNGNVILPTPEDADNYQGGYSYKYTLVDASGKTETRTVTNGSAQISVRMPNMVKATKQLINDNNEKAGRLLEAMGDAAVAITDPTKAITEDGYYTGIKVGGGMAGMMKAIMALVMSQDYDVVTINGEPLMANGEVSLMAILRMMMGDEGYTSQELADLCAGENLTLLDATLQLGTPTRSRAMGPAVATSHSLEFLVELDAVPGGLGQMAVILDALEGYGITFVMEEGDTDNAAEINLSINLPEKVYEIYVAALRMTGKLETNDVNAVREAVIYEFFQDYVKVLLGQDVSTTTFANTAAKLGQTLDVAKYEGIFQKVKGKLGVDGANISFTNEGISALITFTNDTVDNGFDMIMANAGLDADMQSTVDFLKGMIKECKPGATIEFEMNAKVTNFVDKTGDGIVDTDFEAIVIDLGALNAAGMTEKLDAYDFIHAGKLSNRVAGLTSYSAVMLQNDITGNLNFQHAAILDLNGYTITGNVSSTAMLIIVDSSMDGGECGGVTGNVSGEKVVILSGKYAASVEQFLNTGYVQMGNGVVKNSLYTIAEDTTGNIEITIDLDSLADRGLLEAYTATDVSAKQHPAVYLAADLAADLALNYFTTAALALDGNDIYEVNFDDLMALLGSGMTADEKITKVLSVVKMEGIEDFINDLVKKCLNLSGISAAITNDTAIFEYTVATKAWSVMPKYIKNGDYITMGIVSSDETKEFKLSIATTGSDENKQKITSRLDALAEIVTANTALSIDLNELVCEDQTINVIASGKAFVELDLANPDYAAIIGVALAYDGTRKSEFVAALNTYFENGNVADLQAAFNKVTVADLIGAIEKMGSGASFQNMASAIGLSVNWSQATADELEGVYHKFLVGAGKILSKLDVAAGKGLTMAQLEANSGISGTYLADKSNVQRDKSFGAAGYALNVDVTVQEVALKVILFCEHDYVHVVTPPTCTEQGYTTHTCSKCGASYIDTYVSELDHDFSGAWVTDDEYHWHECGHDDCDEINDKAAHSDADNDGLCDTCGNRTGVDDPGEGGDVHRHKYTSTVTEPTCTEQGYTTHTCACGHTYVDSNVNALGHDFETNGWLTDDSEHWHDCYRCDVTQDRAAHSDTDKDGICDVCGYVREIYAIIVMNGDDIVLQTNDFAEAIAAAQDGYTIQIVGSVRMTEHVYVDGKITIIGADKLDDTDYVLYLTSLDAGIAADAKLNIGSTVDGFKGFYDEESLSYQLSVIEEPRMSGTDVAGKKVETFNDTNYLMLDLANDGMTLNALRETTVYNDLSGYTLKFDIEGNDGTGLIKTGDKMTVSTYNADNNCVATITYVVIVMGDTNCNGKVNTSDATVMKSINFGESYGIEVLIAADVNLSGTFAEPKVNSSDATYIMSKWFVWDSGKYVTNLQ